MKKLLLIAVLSTLAISCSKEDSIEINENSSDLTTLVNTNVYGKYTGVFTTLDSKVRGVVDVIIPSNRNEFFFKYNNPTALLTLESGKKIIANSSEQVVSGKAITNMLFENDDLSFLYSVDANGENPKIINVQFNNVEADIRIAKNFIGRAAVNPVTGVFSCSDCKGHPNLTNNTEYTFNMLFASGDTGNQTDVESQIIIPGATSSPFGSNDNLQGPVTTGTTRMLSTVSGTDIGGALSWSASYLKSNSESCNAAIGTWTLNSGVVGETIEGTFSSTNADACKEVFLNANFNSFTGTGFSPTPTAGQIDSDFIAITGFSDGDLAFGGTMTSGDYARGIASSGVSTGGVYAGVVTTGDNCLLIQPIGADFTPGTVTIRVQNDAGLTFSNIQIEADILFRNDQGRSSTFSLEFSTDNATFTAIPGVSSLDTPLASTGSDLILATTLERVIPLSLADTDFLYFRISSVDNGGSGSRDELAVDNIKILAY